jgi:polysaccharide export outer membrane protein
MKQTAHKNNGLVTTIAAWMLGVLAMIVLTTGCQTPANSPTPPASAVNGNSAEPGRSMQLQEGDTIKITFPDAASLDSVQSIRRDGKITLANFGEYPASGKTPSMLEDEIRKMYGSQLQNTNVSVTVQSSAFVVYVFGTVAKPGKIISERPLTPLEALIEAGIDDSKANLKAIQIIRADTAGHTEKFNLNLYKPLHNKAEPMPTFTLKPFDYIYVPQKLNFF